MDVPAQVVQRASNDPRAAAHIEQATAVARVQPHHAGSGDVMHHREVGNDRPHQEPGPARAPARVSERRFAPGRLDDLLHLQPQRRGSPVRVSVIGRIQLAQVGGYRTRIEPEVSVPRTHALGPSPRNRKQAIPQRFVPLCTCGAAHQALGDGLDPDILDDERLSGRDLSSHHASSDRKRSNCRAQISRAMGLKMSLNEIEPRSLGARQYAS